MHKIIAVDCDDVLSDTNESILRFNGYQFQGKPLQRSDISEFYFGDMPGFVKDDAYDKGYFESFFLTDSELLGIPVLPGAKEGIQKLKDFGYSLKIVTGRREIVAENTMKWIDTHFPGIFEDIIFANHGSYYNTGQSKAELMKKIGAEILIDDGLHNCKLLSDAEIPSLLVDAPWNQKEIDAPYIQRVKSWDEIVAYFAGK